MKNSGTHQQPVHLFFVWESVKWHSLVESRLEMPVAERYRLRISSRRMASIGESRAAFHAGDSPPATPGSLLVRKANSARLSETCGWIRSGQM